MLPLELKRALKARAVASGRSMRSVLIEALEWELQFKRSLEREADRERS
jgi:plasmid stability protein